MHMPTITRRTFLTASAATAAAAFSGVSPLACAAGASFTAQRTSVSGPVQGTHREGCLAFYGIPYARAPLGEERWTAPQPPQPWDSVLDCTAPRPTAYQYSRFARGSEDCLHLDVFVPEGAADAPVAVYLHSGGNRSGSAQEVDGAQAATALGCIWVAVEHRLGLLGFNCLPAVCSTEGSSGNFALLDIACALDWVQNEISAFGGDPTRITLFGFGAGSRNTLAALASPQFEGRFQRAVACSGGLSLDDPAGSVSVLAQALAPLAAADGQCATEAEAAIWLSGTDPAVRSWLCGLEPARIAAVTPDPLPQLFADGTVLPSSLEDAAFHPVPLLLLSGVDESSALDGDAQTAHQALQANLLHPADLLAGRHEAPVYLAQAESCRRSVPLLGSFHGVFLPMLAQSSLFSAWMDFSAPEFSAATEPFRAALRNFLASGDPNGADAPLWPAWTPEQPQILTL